MGSAAVSQAKRQSAAGNDDGYSQFDFCDRLKPSENEKDYR